jgi:nucleoside phosphorylase
MNIFIFHGHIKECAIRTGKIMKTILEISRRHFDVVVFVATKGEKESILENTKNIDEFIWSIEHDKNGEVLHTSLLKTTDNRIIRIALQAFPMMGAEACVLYASRFLKDYSCSLVCMVGICAGEQKTTKKGDIIIPGRVASISNGKESEREEVLFRPGNRSHTINEDLRKELSSFISNHWDSSRKELIARWRKAFLKDRRKISIVEKKEDDWPKIHFEEKLFMAQVFHVRAYSGSFEDLKTYASREVIALEMEAAALAYTVEKITSNSKWLIIKGVQDYANGKKDHKYREFCSWASFSILVDFLRKNLRRLWQHKVKFSCRRIENFYCIDNDLEDTYRVGDFEKAIEIGAKIHHSHPCNMSILRTYIRALLRKKRYNDAAEVIDVSDYYLHHENILSARRKINPCENDLNKLNYYIGKADYFRRIGNSNDANVYVERVLNSPRQHNDECVAEAHYMKGHINLGLYDSTGDYEWLREAESCFCEAFEMDSRKYWAGTLCLIVKHLRGEKFSNDISAISGIEKTIDMHIHDTPLRPAPRMYRFRLNALLVSEGIRDFNYLRKIIMEDSLNCFGKLYLPDCFFSSLENDCRKRIFFKCEQGKLRDELLSLLYYWASKVRRL